MKNLLKIENKVQRYIFSISFRIIVLFAGILFINGCKKDVFDEPENETQIQQQLPEIEATIQDLYTLKKGYALNFENRDKIKVKDIFVSEEIKDAVKYQFLTLAEMGMIREYSNKVQVLSNEAFQNDKGELVIPGLETVHSVTIPTDSDDKVESEYTDKTFFHFVEVDGNWKLSGLELLAPNFETDTKYNSQVVYNIAETSNELMGKANKDQSFKVLYEKRKMFEQFFEKKIDTKTLGYKLTELYEINDLLPSEIQLKSQRTLNKSAAVKYALKYTDSSGKMTTTSAYNTNYKSYAPKNCANFVSQCLYAGGWRNESPITDYSLWWYNNKGTSKTSDDAASNVWVGANALYKYVVPSKATLKSFSQAQAGSVDTSDLIWIPRTGTKTHVMIVTQTIGMCLANGKDFVQIYYSAHTSNRKNYNLGSYTDVVFGHF